MKNLYFLFVGLCLMLAPGFSQSGPTASEIAGEMKIGWNIGNSLEVPDGETAWGNPLVNQQLINAVNAAGFNVIRIPCAWNSYADQTTLEIDPLWLARVKEVVDYAYNNGMYVILNSHWDGGWLEENPTYNMQADVNVKQEAYWTQVANYFMNYDEHLIFAGVNEVREDYSEPSAENIEVQESYLQTFIDAVRATGGNNLNRILVVQTYNTNIWHGLNYFTLPTDVVSDRLMVEVHHYDPYGFTISTDNRSCDYWGSMFPYERTCDWANEAYIDDLFNQVKAEWPDNGIPVIMGEYGAVRKSGDADQVASRLYWLEYNTSKAVSSGVIPVYWDNGWDAEGGFALFDRTTGAIVDQDAIDVLVNAADAGSSFSVNTSVIGSGNIEVNPVEGPYEAETSITFTAVPDAGLEFQNWGGDLSGTENPTTISITGNMDVIAYFTAASGGGSGTILREYWTGISGSSVGDLTGSTAFPDSPNGSEQLTSLEGPTNWGDSYGTRIRGYVHPPSTGTYTFWIAGDDDTELWLSTDGTSANASMVAYVNGYTGVHEWDKYNSQEYSVALTGGNTYYIEVLHKEGSGGDNVSVAWQGPGISQAVIPGAYLSPFETGPVQQYSLTTLVTGSGNVQLSPAGGTYNQGTAVTLTAVPDAGYQFDNWTGDVSSSNNPLQITMDADISITANFIVLPPDIPGTFNLISPTGTTNLYSPKFDWEDALNAESYTLVVADNNQYVSPVLNISGLSQSEYTGSSLATNTSYFWKVTATNQYGSRECNSEFNFITKRKLKSTSGDLTRGFDFTIVPNPVTDGLFSISLTTPPTNGQIKIVSTNGKVVKQEALEKSVFQQLYVSDLEKGIYFVLIITSETTVTNKILIK